MTDKPVNVIKYESSNSFAAVYQKPSDLDTVIVKGFVSVQIPDRDNELIDPAAFMLDSFMAAPAVLVNHKLWRNQSGNLVGVGIPLQVAEVKLKSSDTEGMYSVWDVNNKKEIDQFPKDRNPNLKVGVRGLYAFIEVTDPQVRDMVKSGELSGFSWRGYSLPEYVFDPKLNQTFKSYSKIDLVEITLASVPNNIGASLIVSKDAIHSVWFDKKKCTEDEVNQIVKYERLGGEFSLTSDDSKYYLFDKSRQADENGLVVVKMTEGISMLVGKPLASNDERLAEEEVSSFLLAVSKFTQERTMSGTPSQVVVKDTPAVAPAVVPPVVAAVVDPPAAPVVEEVAAPAVLSSEEIITKTTEAVIAKVTPAFEKITEAVQVLSQNFTEMVSKMTTLLAVPVAPAAPPPEDKLVTVQKQVQALTDGMLVVQKSLSGITPSHTPRQETTASAPAAPAPVSAPKSKNDVFNNLFNIKASA